MSTSKLMKVTYYDPKSQIRLLCYADTVVWDTKPTPTLTALRFGGYPERVQGLADAIYGGATIEIEDGKDTYSLKTLTRQYRRELSHDGVYAEATLIAEDDGQSAKQNAGDKDEPDKDKNDEDDDQIQQDLPPRNTYIFCTPGERRELFDAVDQKTAVPMIPEYQDYVLTELQKRNILRPLQVKSLSRKLEAWLLRCEEKDKNIVAVMEDGLKSGAISIPGATVGLNPLDEINSITEYLNTFGVTVAERIKKLFVPLFDPATESLSPEVLAINQYIEDHAGYLRAVRKYLARPELRKYSFSTIAYRAMSCDVHHSKEYWMRKKRRALVESLDEELHTRDLLDPVSAAYENVLSFQELSGKLTQKQRQIAALRAQGYHDLEIARMFQVKPGEIKLEMDQARSKVVPFPTETAALAA